MVNCRFCDTELRHTLVDLGNTPLANSYLSDEAAARLEKSYPLHARVCHNCMLVQVESVVSAEEIFSDYAYFSSFSTSWVEHCKRYVDAIIERQALDTKSFVVELASNDGYLLQHFVDAEVPCLGIEPAQNVAEVAREKGVPTEARFFAEATAEYVRENYQPASLIIANNVLAHVPDLNDFVKGMKRLLADEGIITVEFPHLATLIERVEFDTIYHEHYCYFSLFTLEKVFEKHGLRLFDVDQLPTHGGSLRIYACHYDADYGEAGQMSDVRALEAAMQLDNLEGYQGFEEKVNKVCEGLKHFLAQAKQEGKTVLAYGAAAKGNTLLNVCGVTRKDIALVADKNPHKQDHLMPGSHIPIVSPDELVHAKPDYVLILPWNLADEISKELVAIREWGGQFVTAIPEIEVW